MKYDIMSMSHRIAKRLPETSTYRERLSLALKVEHMKLRLISYVEINWLIQNHPHVDLSLVRTLSKSDRFIITGGYYLTIEHFVEPQTEAQINYGIGVMIESEIKSGNKITLD
jgi:hypothetical protein